MSAGHDDAAGSGAAALLEPARRAEKEQALLYRGLAARAESDGKPDLAQRFHDLHADEQHHLSRLTARVLELGERPVDLSGVRPVLSSLDEWRQTIRECEAAEIERYRTLLRRDLDPATRGLLEEILSTEEHHADELGGKWTMA
ncbi:MAG: ferritin-like domain-containing protein [Gemmatimonadota bacterium]